MVRNARIVEQAVLQFEIDNVSRVRLGGASASKFYGEGAVRHPPHLTRTERHRFIRTYYLLWSLMKLNDPVKWHARLESLSLKKLYDLHELCELPENEDKSRCFGTLALHDPMDEVPRSYFLDNKTRSAERLALTRMTWDHIEERYRQIYSQEAPAVITYAMDEGWYVYVVMWDHWRDALREIVCNINKPQWVSVKDFHWEHWEESSDEDT
ncbi:MAG: hypothetical protein Q9201_003280 [Fulgogasparrea decipioides]